MLAEPSIEIGPSGTLKLFKSFQAYEFNPLGMTRNMTSPLAAGAAAMHQSYKVRGGQRLRGPEAATAASHMQRCTAEASAVHVKNCNSNCSSLVQISEGDVRILRTLGQGASGLVQKAFLPREARFVAIKKISVLEREKRHQLMNDIKARKRWHGGG